MEKALDLLKKNNLRATPIRKQLLRLFLTSNNALSNQDIEKHLSEVDRVTLYRTLKSFQEKGIIHRAFDGTGISKYASCSELCDAHEHHDEHLHFHCVECENTFCIDETPIPKLKMPEGFKSFKTKIVVDGVCQNCS
ncbi:MAG: transcriptional repressor [Bacteroidota bacterium]